MRSVSGGENPRGARAYAPSLPVLDSNQWYSTADTNTPATMRPHMRGVKGRVHLKARLTTLSDTATGCVVTTR